MGARKVLPTTERTILATRLNGHVLQLPGPGSLVNTVAWAATTLLAVAVLVFRFRHGPSRWLGLYLWTLALHALLINVSQMENDPDTAAAYMRVAFGLMLASPFCLWIFLLSWPWQRWPRGDARWKWSLILPMVGLEVAFLVNPAAWMPAFEFFEFLLWLAIVAGGVDSFLRFFQSPPGPVQESLFLVGLAHTSAVLVDTVYWSLTQYRPASTPFAHWAWIWSTLALYLSLLVLVLYVRRRKTVQGDAGRWHDRLMLALPATAVVGALAAAAPFFAGNRFLAQEIWEFAGAISCAGALMLLVYAVVKHQLLGLDVRVKWTLRQGTVGAAFVAVFFIGSEGTQLLLSERIGPYLGLGAAGLLVFAFNPIRRLADRFVEGAMPGVKPIVRMSELERASLFFDQARFAWVDGSLSAKERQILDVAKQRLGLTSEEAETLERRAMGEALRTRGRPVGQPGHA
ncbi:MAG TPA: hypothetical protein VGB18_05800 [Candidatus Thermoplasmatota archaeon]